MRIILGVGNYSHGYGIPYVVHTIAKELQDKGNEVFVLTGKSNFKSEFPVIECGYNETLKHAYVTKALEKIIALKPDVFHSHYYPMDLCGALLSSKTKHIMHLHGILDKKYRWSSKVNLDCLRCGVTESLGVRLSARLIAVSQFIKMEIVNKYGINPDQINVVYPGIDLNLYSPNKRSVLSTTSGVDDLTLISTGAIAERKGQHLLVDVMNEIVKEEPRASLLLIGRTGVEDSSYILKLQERIRKYNLINNVFIKGFLPAKLMPNAYAQADIFVTGTMWEGFGMPIAEAMSSGIPVVTFDTTAMHELINDGINGFKTPAFDIHIFAKKLLQVIQDSKLRQEMGKNGRKYSEKYFDLKKNTSRIMSIYG